MTSDTADAPCESRSVYIVDDEPGILQLTLRGLEKAGFRARGFDSGRAFDAAVAADPPDLCIIDLSIPDMGGVAILKRLGELGYRGGVILISGYGSQLLGDVAALGKQHNVTVLSCVRKPFIVKKLIESLTAPIAAARIA